MEGTQEKSLSEKVYQHFGLDLQQMLEKGQEHDWGIFAREDMGDRIKDTLGFWPEQKQRIVIDYDEKYDWASVRKISIEQWEAEEEGGKEEFYKAVEEIAVKYAATLIKRIGTGELRSFSGANIREVAEGVRALESITTTLEKIERMKDAATEQRRPEE
jgi:hypothetical protein